MVHSPLKIAFFAISWEIKRLEGRESSHNLFIAEKCLISSSNFPADSLELISAKVNSMLLDKGNKSLYIYTSPMIFINLSNDIIEDKSVIFNKLLSQLFNSPIVFNLLLE